MNSYLSFDIAGTDSIIDMKGLKALIGENKGGLITNFFKSTQVKHRLGKILNECGEASRWSYIKYLFGTSKDWQRSTGELMRTDVFQGAISALPKVARFCVPLYMLDSFFQPKGDSTLIPPQIANGLNINIGLNPASLFGGVDYTIKNIYFILDTVDMEIEGSNKVSERAFKQGLSYKYSRVHYQFDQSIKDSKNHTIEVGEPCSFVEKIYTQPVIPGTDYPISMDLTINPDLKSTQLKHGIYRYPDISNDLNLQDTVDRGYRESFIDVIDSFSETKWGDKQLGMRYSDYVDFYSLYAVNLDRDNLPLSGRAVNGDRVLIWDLTYKDLPAGGLIQYNTFIEYSAVVTASLENCTISV